MWSLNLKDIGLLESDVGVQSAILTRSMSGRLKFVLATKERLLIIPTREPKIENSESHDMQQVNLFSVTNGFGIKSMNKIFVKKLASSGLVDETYAPCQTLANLVDIIYDWKNSAQIFALSEQTNELILFTLSSRTLEC